MFSTTITVTFKENWEEGLPLPKRLAESCEFLQETYLETEYVECVYELTFFNKWECEEQRPLIEDWLCEQFYVLSFEWMD